MEVSYSNVLVNFHEALKQKRGKCKNGIDFNTVANSSISVGYPWNQ